MNGVIDRTVIAQAVIALAVCIGAWFLFVEPRTVEAQQLESDIRAGSQQAESTDQEMIQALAQRLDEVRSRIHRIDRRGEITRDSSHLYSVIMDLARTHNVTVTSLNPGSSAPTASGVRGSRSASAHDEFTVQREVAIVVSGRFADVALFVDAVQSLRGYIEVQYLSMAAASGTGDLVSARMTCRTVRFVLPESLRKLLGEETGRKDADKSERTQDDA